MKKERSVCWKAAIGQSAWGKAACRWARTWAIGRHGGGGGSWGGGHNPESAVRIMTWPWRKRCQMRCQERSLRWQSAARMAARREPTAASWRNRQRQPVVRLSRRILSAHQTLKVRPQPGLAWRLLQKTRRARMVLRLRFFSSNPYRQPWRLRVPTTLQCGQGVCLSRWASAVHSSVSRQNHRCWPTAPCLPGNRHFTGEGKWRGNGGVRLTSWSGVARCEVKNRGGCLCRIPAVTNIPQPDDNSATIGLKCDRSGVRDSWTVVRARWDY